MSVRLSVVTRTRGRPLLLARAARSLAAARVADMEWLIVEDDTAPADSTRRIAAQAAADGALAVRTLCAQGRGRTAAANLGLSAAEGVYVHFHDDDDTVEPEFYRATLDFLAERPRYGAVRTMCTRVFEEISGDTVRLHKRRPVYPERTTVSLLDAAEVFAYPPIGSVFERQILLDIGGFDECFDVGEDYELLLRFLCKADMGTIARSLANVHVRPASGGAYANSPMERAFAEEDMLFVNTILRRDLEAGRFGLGHLLALGRSTRRSRTLTEYLKTAWHRLGF